MSRVHDCNPVIEVVEAIHPYHKWFLICDSTGVGNTISQHSDTSCNSRLIRLSKLELKNVFSGTVLHASQKSVYEQPEVNLNGHFIHFECFKLTVSKVTWHRLLKYSPPLHLGDLLSPVKSLEGEQSVVLAFYAGAQNVLVG